jgi:polysaccharide export outer membrane protein
MESVIRDKKAVGLLYQTELDLKVKEIIAQKQKEEEKSRVLTFGSGDVVMISVRDHPELSGRTGVRLTGDIVLPLVNTAIPATGLTLEDLTNQVTEAMKRYVKEPFVTVTVEEYKSKVFYVIDENSATAYPIARPNLTLRDALFISDWGPDRAVGRVLVIKPYKIHPLIKKVDAYDIIYRGNLLNDIRIENGDVIYVPKTATSKIAESILKAVEPVGAVNAGMGDVKGIDDNLTALKHWGTGTYYGYSGY